MLNFSKALSSSFGSHIPMVSKVQRSLKCGWFFKMLFRQGGSISKAIFQLCPVQSIQLQHYTHTYQQYTPNIIYNYYVKILNSCFWIESQLFCHKEQLAEHSIIQYPDSTSYVFHSLSLTVIQRDDANFYLYIWQHIQRCYGDKLESTVVIFCKFVK